MAENTKIEWCDHTASPWHGCTKIAPGCDNCYAAALSVRNPKTLGIWGDDGVRVKSKSFIKNLELWNAQSAKAGKVVSVFPSICDPFEDRPELEPWRAEMFAAIDRLPNVRLLLLTKRPENICRFWPIAGYLDYAVPPAPLRLLRRNIWLGTSIAEQRDADKNISALLKCRDLAPVLFLSCEPLIGPVDLTKLGETTAGITRPDGTNRPLLRYDALRGKEDWADGSYGKVDWVIVGGESGHGARPMHPDWARSIRDQCQAAGVPFFYKQWGEWQNGSGGGLNHIVLADGRHGATPADLDYWAGRPNCEHAWHALKPTAMSRVGKANAGRKLDGREWNEFPKMAARPEVD